MREILFRGKQTDNGEWAYGSLIAQNKIAYIAINVNLPEYFERSFTQSFMCKRPNSLDVLEVNPTTVGQYTGIRDKNGNRIFESDVLKWDEREWGSPHLEEAKWDYDLLDMRKNDWPEWCEVIGNVFDNPELLK